MEKNPAVESFFSDADRWGREARVLRGYLLDCGLSEARKWRKPCYVNAGKNICIMQSFKAFLALLFFKGALLKDPDGVLEPQGPDSRIGYRMRFTSVRQVEDLEASIKACVNEAILIEKSGLRVETRPAGEIELPAELMEAFAEDPAFAQQLLLFSARDASGVMPGTLPMPGGRRRALRGLPDTGPGSWRAKGCGTARPRCRPGNSNEHALLLHRQRKEIKWKTS